MSVRIGVYTVLTTTLARRAVHHLATPSFCKRRHWETIIGNARAILPGCHVSVCISRHRMGCRRGQRQSERTRISVERAVVAPDGRRTNLVGLRACTYKTRGHRLLVSSWWSAETAPERHLDTSQTWNPLTPGSPFCILLRRARGDQKSLRWPLKSEESPCLPLKTKHPIMRQFDRLDSKTRRTRKRYIAYVYSYQKSYELLHTDFPS